MKCSGSSTNLHAVRDAILVSGFGRTHTKHNPYTVVGLVEQTAIVHDLFIKLTDTGMIEKLLKAEYSNSVTTWADALATRIKVGPPFTHTSSHIH